MNSLKDSRVLFFVPGGSVLRGGTFASQVLGQARALISLGAHCAILHKHKGASARVETLDDGIVLINITSEDPGYNVFRLKSRYKKVIDAFEREIVTFGPTHIYTREYSCTLAVRGIATRLSAKLIYSMRGPDALERRKQGGLKNLIASVKISRDVRSAVKVCDAFTTLSSKFVEWCNAFFGRDSIMIPCCVADRFFVKIKEDEREKIRAKLGFGQSDRIVVWCGNVAYWQMLDKIVLLMNKLFARNMQYKFLFLADSPKVIEEICTKVELPCNSYIAMRADPNDVPKLLQSCDIGIDVLSEDDFKSSICCPIKVGEYLASGLPVVISSVMGDYPQVIQKTDTGIVLDRELSVNKLDAKLEHFFLTPKEYYVDIARKYWSWDSYRNELITLFS